MKLLTSRMHHGTRFVCKVDKKLDHEESHTVQCKQYLNRQSGTKCNGNKGFCGLKFNEVTFAGAHNAGTGMLSQLMADCYVTNHDLNVTELLDFGIRFFDFDNKYYEENDDMWTGHGPKNLFFTTARFEEVLQDFQQWMTEHPDEVVIVYIGQVIADNRGLGIDKLARLFDKYFSGPEVKLNDYWRVHGDWPTLQQAIDSNERLFAFGKFNESLKTVM